jgi:molybdopterin synthase sulfur carrier subunit
MRVLVPSPLFSYTGRKETSACGGTLAEVLRDLDRQYPGIRFRMIDEQDRIRPHIRIFVNGEETFALDRGLDDRDVVQVIQALSGG